jgi:hypothetical protein
MQLRIYPGSSLISRVGCGSAFPLISAAFKGATRSAYLERPQGNLLAQEGFSLYARIAIALCIHKMCLAPLTPKAHKRRTLFALLFALVYLRKVDAKPYAIYSDVFALLVNVFAPLVPPFSMLLWGCRLFRGNLNIILVYKFATYSIFQGL